MCTNAPGGPELGERLAMTGGVSRVNIEPLLARPLTVTTSGPVVAPAGTGAVMLVGLQLVGVAAMPLNVTVLLPCAVPNVVPEMITAAPTEPDVRDRFAIAGGTANDTPLLASPFTVTETFPLVAPGGTGAVILVAVQLVGAAVTPLNRTLLLPCVVPRFDPLIVTAVPTGPDDGDTPLIVGVAIGSGVTSCES
jgi:hypothetical protein